MIFQHLDLFSTAELDELQSLTEPDDGGSGERARFKGIGLTENREKSKSSAKAAKPLPCGP